MSTETGESLDALWRTLDDLQKRIKTIETVLVLQHLNRLGPCGEAGHLATTLTSGLHLRLVPRREGNRWVLDIEGALANPKSSE